MARLPIYATAAALALLAGAAMAQPTEPNASLRGGRALQSNIFYQPRVNGIRVDFCYGHDSSLGPNNPNAYIGCGQPAADAFCRTVGFPDGALSFDKVVGITEDTIYLQQMTRSYQPTHDSFNSITCRGGGGTVSPGTVNPSTVGGSTRDFYQPRTSNGKRVDYCAFFNPNLPGGRDNQMAYTGCGQQAAEIFCRGQGFNRAVRFEKGTYNGFGLITYRHYQHEDLVAHTVTPQINTPQRKR